jgi:AAA+ ATPase superfamily predicted ATPase
MIKIKNTIKKQVLIGRITEQAELRRIGALKESAILIVYGRRRVGKTELIESVYADRNLIKIEGAEGVEPEKQLQLARLQLEVYIQENSFRHSSFSTWLELFKFLAPYLQKGKWTLYFEELQWLAGEKSSFIAEFKIAWDNYLRHNPELLVVLCGSSPSFMINQVIKSKALYNRSQYELHLKPFSLKETWEFIGKEYSYEQALDAHLLVGGIPEYLKYIKHDKSTFLSMCKNSFKANGFFVNEYEKVFTSSLSNNPNYKLIIELLSLSGTLNRPELIAKLKLKSGGGITKVLNDLLLCGFIDRFSPYQLKQDGKSTRLAIADNYLQFYFRFIKPLTNEIANGKFDKDPTQAVARSAIDQFLAYSFERYCRANSYLIADILGFPSIKYLSGVYYKRGDISLGIGYQWDLVFDRADKVLTLCEIKYSNAPVGVSVIREFEERLEKTRIETRKTIQRVLISVNGATEQLLEKNYFDRVITLDDLFSVS